MWLELKLAERSQWVKVFDPRDCTLFVPGKSDVRVGDYVRLDLSIDDSGPRVIFRGKVISRRDEPEGGAPVGCSIALGPEEREKINYLNGFVRGGLLNLRERRRLPLRIPVTYGGVDGPCRSFTRDVNEEGVFIVAEDPLPEDSEVHLLIDFPGEDEATSVNGIVSHTVVIEDEDVPGMGIVFEFDDTSRAEFSNVIDRVEQAFLKGTLADEYLL